MWYKRLLNWPLSFLSQGTVFYLLNLAIEYRVWTWVPECLVGAYQSDTGSHPDEDEDEDVQRERERVMLKDSPEDVLAVKGLSKRYSKKARLAVDRCGTDCIKKDLNRIHS